MEIMKKSLVLILLIIFSSLVIAQSRDLDVCVDTCKSNFEDEESRSPCIRGCKDKYDFGPEIYGFDPEMKDCQDKCKSIDNKETRGNCIKRCKAEFGPKKLDPDCDDYCNDFWTAAMPTCPGEQATSGVYPDCECGWKCFDEEDKKEDIFKGYEGEELKIKAGTTPGSPLYFIDRFFDRFADELTVKEERIAEIKALVEAGDVESAKGILKDYMELAEELEHEVDPDRKEDVKRSAAAIRNAMKDIRDKLPPGERGDFVSEIMSKEHSIATSAEISSKIKELCKELSELDPLEYSSVCKTKDDSPKWQQKLDKKLTKEQVNEAKKFGKIMKSCFDSSGKDCRCDEIPFPDFANACSKAAPLAAACETENDEDACNKLDNLEMPRLPPHLQEVMENLEGGDVMESKFDLHMPPECAGVSSPKECKKIMIKRHAPEECREALLAADVENEMESRKICDKIMMEKHAPECSEKGITDPDECARFMDKLGGEHKGPRIDFNCKKIENPEERLECYDKASSQAKGYKGHDDEDYEGPCMTEKDWKDKKKECRDLYGNNAGDKPIKGDSGDGYECVIDAECVDFSQPDDNCLKDEDWKAKKQECRDLYGEGAGDEPIMGDSGNGYRCAVDIKCIDFGPKCEDCESKCPGAYKTDCINNECKCYYEDGGEDGGSGCDDCSSECPEVEGKLLSGTDCINNKCECYYRVESECKDGCHEECGDQNTDCVDGKCICLGYGDDHRDECDDCSSKCGDKGWDCSNGRCLCFEHYGGDDSDSSGDTDSSDGTTPDSGSDSSDDVGSDSGSSDSGGSNEGSLDRGSDSGSDDGSHDSSSDSSDDSSKDGTASDSGSGGTNEGSDSGSSDSSDSGSSDSSSDSGSDSGRSKESSSDSGSPDSGSDGGGSDSGSDSGSSDSGDSGSSDSGDSGGMDSVTGNAFLDYWYN